MAIKLGNRAAQTSDTQGTGTLSLIPPASGSPLQSLAAALGLTSNGQSAQTIYLIEQGAEWEIGIGTVTKGNPDTLSRDQIIESTNSGAAVDWGAGTRNVVLTVDARSILLASGGTVEGNLTVEGDAGIGGRLTASSLQVGGDVSATSFNGGPLGGFRNKIINGNFDIWQRGTSQSVGGYGSADRWVIVPSGATMGASRQDFAVGQTDVPGSPKHFIRVSATVGNDHARIEQRIEGVGTLAGQKATVSFWARGTNPGGGSFYATFGQSFGTGGAPSPTLFDIGTTPFVVTSQWQKFSVTVELPSIAGKTLGTDGNDHLQVAFSQGPDTSTAPWTLDLARVSLVGGDATGEADPFEPRPIGLELMLCQRYYFEFTAGLSVSNRDAAIPGQFPVPLQMRAVTVATLSDANWSIVFPANPIIGFITLQRGGAGAATCRVALDAEL